MFSFFKVYFTHQIELHSWKKLRLHHLEYNTWKVIQPND